METGIWKHFSDQLSRTFEGAAPCEYGNQVLLDTLKAHYSNIMTVGIDYYQFTPELGENFTLVEEIVTPAPPPVYIAPPPLIPELLPPANYPALIVEPLLYRVTELRLDGYTFIDPTPQTSALFITLIFLIIITELKLKEQTVVGFIPIFFEPHLLLKLLFSGAGRKR